MGNVVVLGQLPPVAGAWDLEVVSGAAREQGCGYSPDAAKSRLNRLTHSRTARFSFIRVRKFVSDSGHAVSGRVDFGVEFLLGV